MTQYKVGIICAADTEAAPFLPLIQNCQITEKAMLKFYEGKIEELDVTALFCGVCKVNAAIASQILIDTFGCNVIINAGTAGGLAPSLHVLDTVVATDCVYWDVDDDILTTFHPWMPSSRFPADEMLLMLAKDAAAGYEHPVVFGTMVTGEAFIADDRRDEIIRCFQPLSVDMETAAIAHVCHVNKARFLSIRTITDTANHSAAASFEENCVTASRNSAKLTVLLLRKLREAIRAEG